MQEHEALTKLLGFEAGSTPHWGAPPLYPRPTPTEGGEAAAGSGWGSRGAASLARHEPGWLHNPLGLDIAPAPVMTLPMDLQCCHG